MKHLSEENCLGCQQKEALNDALYEERDQLREKYEGLEAENISYKNKAELYVNAINRLSAALKKCIAKTPDGQQS